MLYISQTNVYVIVMNKLQPALNYESYKHITRVVSVGTAPVTMSVHVKSYLLPHNKICGT